ncbi:hypothetical protein [Thalassospira sp.]|uniref:hypothetical protein n=1 Tax=Thalassospira sp. TaxID=1912094 RepID=UPI003AA7B510
MERIETTIDSQVAAWIASGGAASVESVIATQDQGVELQSAMLTRSPQTCYSIDQGVELQSAMLTRSPQTCYSIDRDDKGLSTAAYTHSIECRIR